MPNRPPLPELELFMEQCPPGQAGLKRALATLRAWAEELPNVARSFVARPGVSHSLRFDLDPRPAGRRRPVFFLVDVVASANELFLSVCFYEDEINDPQELGNAIPQGLFMETGYCFDVDDYDEAQMAYLHARLGEAHTAAEK